MPHYGERGATQEGRAHRVLAWGGGLASRLLAWWFCPIGRRKVLVPTPLHPGAS